MYNSSRVAFSILNGIDEGGSLACHSVPVYHSLSSSSSSSSLSLTLICPVLAIHKSHLVYAEKRFVCMYIYIQTYMRCEDQSISRVVMNQNETLPSYSCAGGESLRPSESTGTI